MMLLWIIPLLLLLSCTKDQTDLPLSDGISSINKEKHLKNIRQLTFGGQNAEAYFSHDGKRMSVTKFIPWILLGNLCRW